MMTMVRKVMLYSVLSLEDWAKEKEFKVAPHAAPHVVVEVPPRKKN